MEELKWITQIGNVGYPLVLLVMVFHAFKMFMEKYPEWKKTEQESKDKRAAGFQAVVKDLTVEIKDSVSASREGTRLIQESLAKAADKDQTRHGEVMNCLGGLRGNNSKESSSTGRAGS